MRRLRQFMHMAHLPLLSWNIGRLAQAKLQITRAESSRNRICKSARDLNCLRMILMREFQTKTPDPYMEPVSQVLTGFLCICAEYGVAAPHIGKYGMCSSAGIAQG